MRLVALLVGLLGACLAVAVAAVMAADAPENTAPTPYAAP